MATTSKQSWKLSDDDKKLIVEKYLTGQYTHATIARRFDLSRSAIGKILKARGVPNTKRNKSKDCRKHQVNDNYFDSIDTEDKSYLLGLLYADGWNSGISIIRLKLQARDIELLELLKHHTGSTAPIIFIPVDKPNHQNVYKFEINNKHMAQQLTLLGCGPRKSLTLKFPTSEEVPEHLLKHFVRGYLDGDGCICNSLHVGKYNEYPTTTCSFHSSYDFNIGLSILINTIFGFLPTVRYGKRKESGVLTIHTKKALLFLDWLYQDANIFLRRKYDKFLEGKAIQANKRVRRVTQN